MLGDLRLLKRKRYAIKRMKNIMILCCLQNSKSLVNRKLNYILVKTNEQESFNKCNEKS